MAEERVKVLSDEEVEKVNRWVSSKVTNTQCESCGREDWTAGPVVRGIGLDLSEDGVADWDNPSMSMLQLLCDNCGYIRTYNAGMIGLL